MSQLALLADKKSFRTAVLCLLALLAAVSVFAGVRNALEFSQDFQWDAAKALTLRLDPYELSLDQKKALDNKELAGFYRMFTDRGLKQKMEANQFPSLLMLLIPMTFIPPTAAKVVWCVLNILFTAGILYLVRKTFLKNASAYGYAVMSLLMIAGTPYRNQLGVGQHTLFAFFFFMLAVYIEEYRPFASSLADTLLTAVCLFVSLFKYTLTAPLMLYFLYRKRYRELVIPVIAHLILTEVAALWLGKSFIYMIKAPLGVASVLASSGGIDLGVLFGGTAGMIVAALIAVVLLVITLLLPKDKEYILFPMLILWSLILTYHRMYDFFVLLVVAMLFYRDLKADFGEKVQNALACGYITVVVSVYFVLRLFDENNASKIVTGVLYYLFTIAVSMLAVKLIRKKNIDNG